MTVNRYGACPECHLVAQHKLDCVTGSREYGAWLDEQDRLSRRRAERRMPQWEARAAKGGAVMVFGFPALNRRLARERARVRLPRGDWAITITQVLPKRARPFAAFAE